MPSMAQDKAVPTYSGPRVFVGHVRLLVLLPGCSLFFISA